MADHRWRFRDVSHVRMRRDREKGADFLSSSRQRRVPKRREPGSAQLPAGQRRARFDRHFLSVRSLFLFGRV